MKRLVLILVLAAMSTDFLPGANHPHSLDEVVSTVPDGDSLQEAFEQARYAARPVEGSEGHWSVQNPAHGLSARFSVKGLSLQVRVAGGPSPTPDSPSSVINTRWRTTGIGYGDELLAVSEGEVVAESATPGRVEIRRPGLVEWYVNRPAGLEHGYTVPSPPAIDPEGRPLRVEMELGGDLDAEITADGFHVVLRDTAGTEILRYEKLKVWDAEGRELAARMVGGGRKLGVEVVDTAAVYPITIDPVFVQEDTYLKASNTDGWDQFGRSVAVDGNTVVVGAPWDDSNATTVNGHQGNSGGVGQYGSAYVFVHNGATWSQQAYLKASNAGTSDQFGSSVAISGNTIVVGATLEDSNVTGVNGSGSNNSAVNSGAAYVFVRNGSTWSQQAYLKASNTGAGDGFGTSVAVDGNTVVVGASKEESFATGINGDGINNLAEEAGAAYVFVRSGSTWSQQAYLKASNTDAGDNFGNSVALSDNTIVVGSVNEDSGALGINGSQSNVNSTFNSGAAYVFVRSGSSWSQQAYIKASNTGLQDAFANSVAVSGNTVVIGAPLEDSRATGVNGNQGDDSSYGWSGSAYVFVRNGSTWSQEAYLKASNTGSGHKFGNAVAVDGNKVVIGAYEESGGGQNDAGAAYVFTRSGSAWAQHSHIKASNTNGGDRFGVSVDLSENAVVAGAHFEGSNATGVNGNGFNNNATNSGAAYVYQLEDAPTTTLSLNPPTRSVLSSSGIQSFTVSSSGSWSWSMSGGSGWVTTSEATNQSGNQTFSYNLSANNGSSPRSATITLTAGSVAQTHTITQAGTTAAPLLSMSGNLAFGSVEVGQSTTRTLTLSNLGNATLSVTSIEFPDGFSIDWSAGSIPAGGSRNVNVTFAPLETRDYLDNVYVSSNSPEADTYWGISGTGIMPPAPPMITVTQPRGFSTIAIGKGKSQRLIVSNIGGTDISGLRVRIDGRASRDFRVVGPAESTLSPGESTSVTVTFRPRKNGVRKAGLIVGSGSITKKVVLSGRGK